MAKQQRVDVPYRPAVGVEGETVRRPLAPVFTARSEIPPMTPVVCDPDVIVADPIHRYDVAPPDPPIEGEVETLDHPGDDGPAPADEQRPTIPEDDPETEPEGPEPYWRAMDTAPRDRPIFLTDDPEVSDGVLSFWRTTRVRDRRKSTWDPCSFWARLMDRRAVPFEPAAWRPSGMFRAAEPS